jgi:hypothetical protein
MYVDKGFGGYLFEISISGEYQNILRKQSLVGEKVDEQPGGA